MALSEIDIKRLHQALALAHDAIGVCDPNPRVGCVIGHSDGSLLGAGSTQAVGGPHAEVMAMRQAQSAGHSLRGAHVWVSLEPCAHHGRTPPCCDALINAGVSRVVVATTDPYPKVAGKGIARLRAAGIQVELAEAEIATAAKEINIGFFSRVLRQRPWVRLKVATSLDGRTALLNGRSQWITGTQARADGHSWRKRAGAVLTGIGTVLADDPRLDVRLVPTQQQPLRVVLDSQLRLPVEAKVLRPPGRCMVVHCGDWPAKVATLQQAGAEVLRVSTAGPSPVGANAIHAVELGALMTELHRRDVNELHVEAGPRLNASLLAGGWVDELLLYQAPMLLGIARDVASLGPLEELVLAQRFTYTEVNPLGADLRIRARPLRASTADALLKFLADGTESSVEKVDGGLPA
jgi:diaminohydroxyphosphoribosylaminopyrimidine deaminase / 5-amino-6-(5-phosphoribosylamino)uracil reductase